VAGALYYNSTDGVMKVYDGGTWIAASAASQAIMVEYEYTATAGQTTFTGADDNALTLSYTAGSIIVTLNGVVLDASDYTATNGNSVVLAVGASAGDELNVRAFSTFDIANTYTQAQVDAFAVKLTGNQTVAGVKTFSDQPVMSAGISLGSNGQIVFPATQNASANANTLDDYEEGTWTPSIGGTATYTPAKGTYTKIGKLVTFQMTLYVATLGTGSQDTISGLPFTNTGAGGDMMGATMNYFGDLNVSVNYLAGYIPGSSSSIIMTGTTSTAASISVLNVIKSTTYLEMSGYYYTS
jgi:hypothetical protein